MKAISILMVIAGHLFGNYCPVNLYVPVVLGTGGVTVFLLLSGYGLAASYKSRGITASYWTNKIRKIMIPYWVVTILFIIIRGLYSLGGKVLLKTMLFVDFDRNVDGTMWYLSFLIIWYVLFFMIFIWKFPDWVKLVILFLPGVWFLLHEFSTVFLSCEYHFCRNALSFPLGVALGLFCSNRTFTFLSKTWVRLLLIAGSLLGIAGYLVLQTDDKELVQINGFFVFILLFCICLAVEKHSRMLSRILDKIGDVSYMMYLVEGKWFSLLAMIGISLGKWTALVYIGSLAVFMILYHFGVQAFRRRIRRGRQ